jgi:predicted transcriptional regulator
MNNSFYITPNKKIGKYQDLGAGKVTQENIGGNNRPTVYPTTSTDSETLSDISFTYNSIYAISYSANLSSFILSIPLDSIEGFSPQENLSWCIFDSSSESWYLLESDQTDTSLSVDLTSVSLNYETSILTVVSILQPTTPFWETSWGITILILGAIAIVFGLLMSKAEYRSYLLNRAMPLETGPHRLSMEEILENENRLKIIDIIIDHPGIHFNALLREIGISAGNLAWHLDLLETFKVVRKERMGQYLMYYPYLEKNPISRLDPKLQKSKTTLEILRLIDDNPGIYQNQIAKRLDIDHKTVKYHIDKLIENEIIYMKKEKGNKGFYPHEWPVVDADFDTHE